MTILPDNITMLAKLYKQHGKELYLVGGCVRDICLGKTPHDYDMCTDALPEESIDILKKAGIGINPKGLKYGTVTAMIQSDEFEITTYRRDGYYHDNRRPDTVLYTTDIEQDLCRRDFTINAMAMNPLTNQIIDKHNGMDDLRNKIIRTVGSPTNRFSEDALRILRCIRFAVKFGFNIEDNTKKAMTNCRHLLKNIAKERITDEFRKIFATNMPIADVFLDNHDIIFEIIPELRPCYKFQHHNRYHKHDVYEHMLHVTDKIDTNKCSDNNLFIIKMTALLHDIGKPAVFTMDENGVGHCYKHPVESYNICKLLLKNDFRISSAEETYILTLIENHDIDAPQSKKSAKRFLNKFGTDFADTWIIFKDADIADHIFYDEIRPSWARIDKFKELLSEIKAENDCFTIKSLKINGNDLIKELNIETGKLIGDILNHLLNAVIDESVENNYTALLQEAANYIKPNT